MYNKTIKIIKNKFKKEGKINVCFFVIDDTGFQNEYLYKQFLADTNFNSFLVVIPHIIYSKDLKSTNSHLNQIAKIDRVYNYFSNKYNNVYKSYDENTLEFIDFSNKIDLVFFTAPYDHGITHNFYTHSYLSSKKSNKDILPCYVNYMYSGRTKFEKRVSVFTRLMWKFFCESKKSINEIQKLSKVSFLKKIFGKSNLVLSGYPKMDFMQHYKKQFFTRKKIIIAPHHTVVSNPDLNLSNFLQYYNFFLELPSLYPEIDFIFRPHTLLFAQLLKHQIWSQDQIDQYIKNMQAHSNFKYIPHQNYFELFINSDALIHDCGSFLAEYFYTNNPQCYILKNKQAIKNEFLSFGKEMLEHTYNAFSKEDIINFIDKVVLQGDDAMKSEREKFAKRHIIYNYPNASNSIINYIKKQLL